MTTEAVSVSSPRRPSLLLPAFWGAVPVVAWTAVAAVLTLALLPQISDYVSGSAAFTLTWAVLLGASFDFTITEAGGSGGVSGAGLPLLVLVATAMLLGTVVRRRPVPTATSAALTVGTTIAWWLAAMIIVAVLPAPFTARFATGEMEAGVRPHVPVVGALLLWGLAWATRWAPVRAALWVVLATAAGLAGMATIVLSQSVSEMTQAIGAAGGVLLASVNLVAMLVLWPLGHQVQSSGVPISFTDAADSAPLLWAVPVVLALLLLVWCTSWHTPPTLTAFGRRLAVTLGSVVALVTLLPLTSGIAIEPFGGAVEHMAIVDIPLGLSTEVSIAANVSRALLLGLLVTLVCAAVWFATAYRDGARWTRDLPATAQRLVARSSRSPGQGGGAAAPSSLQPKFCANCGTEAKGRFCGSCGTPVAS